MSRDDVRVTRSGWDADADSYQSKAVPQLNRWDRLGWGVWEAPEDEVGALGNVEGLRVLELGCGGGQFGIKVAMRGADVIGLDVSGKQLGYAAAHVAETGVHFPLVQASAEELPFAGGSFDLVFCDHGGTSFTDPHLTIPETARVLRPGGSLVFNMATPLIWLCWPDQDTPPGRELVRDYFDGLGRGVTGDETERTIEWQLPYGDWIRLFRSCGLAVEDLIELRPDPECTDDKGYASKEWARAFPAEHIWKLRKE